MAMERILGTETGKSAFEKTDRNVVALDASLTADKLDLATHKAESATQANLGHVKLPSAWQAPTMINGWIYYENGPRFRKDDFGKVTLKGTTASGTADTIAFILPVGYRPPQLVRVTTFTAGAATGRVVIDIDGSVKIVAFNTYVSLDNVSFYLN